MTPFPPHSLQTATLVGTYRTDDFIGSSFITFPIVLLLFFCFTGSTARNIHEICINPGHGCKLEFESVRFELTFQHCMYCLVQFYPHLRSSHLTARFIQPLQSGRFESGLLKYERSIIQFLFFHIESPMLQSFRGEHSSMPRFHLSPLL